MARCPGSIALADLADEELVARFHLGDLQGLDTLLGRYRGLARGKARSYFLVGGDVDDVEQEGMIGLYKAARDFQPALGVSFRAFAEVCMTRQVITAVKAATRHKHTPLNRYVSLSEPRSSRPSDRGVEVVLDDPSSRDPAEEVLSGERIDALSQFLARVLTGLELDVLRLHVEGRSYADIAARLGREAKSVDNALQRIKRKVEVHLDAVGVGDVGAVAVA